MYKHFSPLLSFMLFTSATHAVDEYAICRDAAAGFSYSADVPDHQLPVLMAYLYRAADAARSEYNFIQDYNAAISSLVEYKTTSMQESTNHEGLVQQVACLTHYAQQNRACKVALTEIEEYMSSHPDEYSSLLVLLSEAVYEIITNILIHRNESLNENLSDAHDTLKSSSLLVVGNMCNNIRQNQQEDPAVKADVVFRLSEFLHKDIVHAIRAQGVLQESLCLMLLATATFFDYCYEFLQTHG